MLQGTGDAKHDRPPNLVHKVVLDMLMKKGCAHERALCTAAADATYNLSGHDASNEDRFQVRDLSCIAHRYANHSEVVVLIMCTQGVAGSRAHQVGHDV